MTVNDGFSVVNDFSIHRDIDEFVKVSEFLRIKFLNF